MAGEEDLVTLVDRLQRDRRQHPYRGRSEYSQAARAVAEVCERLIGSGQAMQALPVLRKAVDRMTRALMYMDDSSGIVGDDLRDIMSLYARACTAAPPKPAALANWLVTLACDGPGWPRIRLCDFADALGDRGLADVTRMVETRARTADPESWTAMFAVRDLREQLAEVSGDLDRYVTVLAEHLTSAIQYERITHALGDAGRHQDAIIWARRGLAAKPGWPHTDQLRDTLVGILLAEGQPDAAVEVRRDEFARHPTATAYRALAATNAEVKADDPAPWALETLTERVARQSAYAGELLDVLSILDRHDEAWHVAQQHRTSLGDQQWLSLLEQRRTDHPEDVLTPYQDMIERHIQNSADKHRYRRAVALLRNLRDAYAKAGDQAAFTEYLEELRARHARRPTFIKTLDAADL
jgi:Ku C terminal domain like